MTTASFTRRFLGSLATFTRWIVLCCVGLSHGSALALAANTSRFIVVLPTSLQHRVTGRVFVFVSKQANPEPRLDAGTWYSRVVFSGKDVLQEAPGAGVTFNGSELAFPRSSLNQIQPGTYYVQALLTVYAQFHRSDGHVIWAHADAGEGQQFARSPGNFYSAVRRVHIGPGTVIHLLLSNQIPSISPAQDTEWVKHVRIQSELLTKFWGTPIYLSATILLPNGYDSHPDAYYPVLYEQGHFSRGNPLDFSPAPMTITAETEGALRWSGLISGYDFYRQWISPDFPRMIVVTFQHPTVYFDDSYAVNSANNGPYGDAIVTELIPWIEGHFRIIAQPYARVLSGGSTGGWEALALQIEHPRFFGGTWSFYPDPLDFTRYQLIDIYHDDNAFLAPGYDPPVPERPMERTVEGQTDVTVRQMSTLEQVLGTHDRGGQQYSAWEATYGPVGSDGYPKPLWDPLTGKIDHSVAAYMRERGYDLRYYLQMHWSEIGPDLVGKLHIYCGDKDNFFLDASVSRLEEFLKSTQPFYSGTVQYGYPFKGHGWHPFDQAELIRRLAQHVKEAAPTEPDRSWEY